ncbi:hypothetical protein V6N13_000959 [Hibiscus sabdariffa]
MLDYLAKRRVNNMRAQNTNISSKGKRGIDRKQEDKTSQDGSSKSNGQNTKTVQGYVEDESLWKLSKCLVGSMAMACSTDNVKERLHRWRLRELTVKSLGGQNFLIEIPDEELLKTFGGTKLVIS